MLLQATIFLWFIAATSVAGCIIHMIQHSRMSTVLPNRVLRCNFNIPAAVASAEPAPRHGASSAVAHRRRR